MQCEQVEKRLNQLLDRRRHWASDRDLAAHCATCADCRSIAEAYATFDRLGRGVPSLSADFATRVVGELLPNYSAAITRPSRTKTTSLRRNFWQWFAVAATVLVATAIGFRSLRSPDLAAPQQGSEAFAAAWPIHVEIERLLGDDRQLSEVVWQSTGREFAKLPHQVRRAADLSDASRLTGAIRPVAAAWQSFRRVLPGESMPVQPATGETSASPFAAARQWA